MTHQIALHHLKVGMGSFWRTTHIFLNLLVLIPTLMFGLYLGEKLSESNPIASLASLLLALGQLGMATVSVHGVRGRVRRPSGESEAEEALPSLPLAPFKRHLTNALAAMCSVALLCGPPAILFALTGEGHAARWLARFFVLLAPPTLLFALMNTDRGFHQLAALGVCVALPHLALEWTDTADSLLAAALAAVLMCALVLAFWRSGALDAYLQSLKHEPGAWRASLHETPRPPAAQWRRQIWRYQARDILPVFLLGVFVWTINNLAEVSESGAPPQAHLLQAIIAGLAIAGAFVPLARRNYPLNATSGGGVRTRQAIESYRVLPLPRWRIYRGLLAQSFFTLLVLTPLWLGGWWLGNTLWPDHFTPPTLALIALGGVIVWPMLFAQGEGWRWWRIIIYGIGGAGFLIYAFAVLDFTRKGNLPDGWLVVMIAACFVVPYLIVARAMFPPRRRG